MKKAPMISVVTPAYRAEYFIKPLIDNFSKITYPNLEFLLIFDRSPDKGIALAKRLLKHKKNWRIIINKQRQGISKSLNLGIRLSKGRYVTFLMTDVEVDPNCIWEQVNFLEKEGSGVGAVAPKILDYHQRDRIQTYNMYLIPQTGFLYIPEYGFKDIKYNKIIEGYSGIDGTLFKKEVLDYVGPFDTDIDLSINDLDLVWRIWIAGYKVLRLPSARIYHWSLKEGRGGEKWEFTYAKMIDIFIQNYSMRNLLKYLPQMIIIYSARSLLTFLQGNPDPLKGWIKALYWSFFYLPKALQKRRVVQSLRKVNDDYLEQKIFRKMSIWDFYKHVRWVQKNITPIMLNKQSADERILTYSK